MKRVLVLVATIGLVLPAAAHAGTWQGVVIAKNAKRKAVVTASTDGAVRTVRIAKPLAKIGLGAVLAVRATALPDGTFAANAFKQLRRARHAHVRATVVKRAGRWLYLSGGHSVFALSLRNRAGAKLHAGDRVLTTASVGRRQLFCDDVTPIGHDDQLELEGIYLSTEGDVLSIAVHGRGLVKVAVPDGFELTDLKAGDELSLLVTVEPDGSFTLVSLDDEDANDDGSDDDGVDMGDNWFSVTGVLSSLSATQVGVDVERHSHPVRCGVPPKLDLSGFVVGQFVEMSCKYVDGRFVLVSLRSKTAEIPGDSDGSIDLNGFIAALDATKVTVSVPGAATVAAASHESQLVACAFKPGEDLRGFAVGDFVELGCKYSAAFGHYMLTYLSSSNARLMYADDRLKQWFELDGVVSTLGPGYIAVQVPHHAGPVQCSLPAGMDLRGFAVGDAVAFACLNEGAGFYVKAISSDNASWPADGMPDFTLIGSLRSMRTDGVGIQVAGYPSLVNCAMPAGTDLSGFALGDTVEMHCHFHDGTWNLAHLRSSSAELTLEP